MQYVTKWVVTQEAAWWIARFLEHFLNFWRKHNAYLDAKEKKMVQLEQGRKKKRTVYGHCECFNVR